MTNSLRTILLSLVLLGLGAAGAYFLILSSPTTEPSERKRAPKLVQTVAIAPRDQEVVVSGYGTAIPAREITIQPQVSGALLSHHEALVPGGLVRENDLLLSIDRTEYDYALAKAEAARKEALFELAVEQGRQTVAAREWKELKDELRPDQVNEALVLRQPHLDRAKALVAKADNDVAQANLDLERTRIAAPFNAVVLSEAVEVGQLLTAGQTVATLGGTDRFWVRVTLPLADLQQIKLPAAGRPGASATVVLPTADDREASWRGEVARLLGDLEPVGRLARLLVTVPDPLRLEDGHDGLPLLLGSYVRVDIEAGRLENVLEIPRAALREGDRVWLVGKDNRLRIRQAEILWRQRDSVLIANLLEEGADERLVVSGLKSALPGMELSPQALPTAPRGTDGAEASESPAAP